MKTLKILTLIGLSTFLFYSFTIDSTNDWVIPAKYKTMKNPTAASKENITVGKTLYTQHCKSCHGKEGYGDGPKADGLKGDLGDFSSAAFHKQTDGELFYKISFGKDDMPAFNKKVAEDDDRWMIVSYMRTLKD